MPQSSLNNNYNKNNMIKSTKKKETMKPIKYVFYKFQNSNDIHKARFLSKCRKQYKGLNYIRILPLTQSQGICRIPEICIINNNNQ